MSYAVRFKLIGLPTPGRNARRHWRKERDENVGWYSAVAFATLGKRPDAPLRHAFVELVRHSFVEPDPDNLADSFKPIVDGLVKAGILVNDRASNFAGGRPVWRWEPAPARAGFVTVRVEERVPPYGSSEEDREEEPGSDHDHRPEHREKRVAE